MYTPNAVVELLPHHNIETVMKERGDSVDCSHGHLDYHCLCTSLLLTLVICRQVCMAAGMHAHWSR